MCFGVEPSRTKYYYREEIVPARPYHHHHGHHHGHHYGHHHHGHSPRASYVSVSSQRHHSHSHSSPRVSTTSYRTSGPVVYESSRTRYV